jgi:hypothetical protein
MEATEVENILAIFYEDTGEKRRLRARWKQKPFLDFPQRN